MAWQVFGNLAAGNEPANLFDTLTGQIVNCVNIPCTASGATTVALTVTTNAGPVTSYQFGQTWSWVHPGNSSGAVTINGATLGAKKLFTDNTAVTQVGVSGTSLLNGARYSAMFDPALDAAAGAFYLVGTPAVVPPSVTPNRGYLFGNILSGGGSQTLTITGGQCTSDDFTTLMTLSSTYTKTFAAWAVGTGNGGLDTGSIANNTWYHVYIIERTDTSVVDVLISTSATTPTMPTNYTVKRRVGSIKTDATPNIITFNQNGDTFVWNTIVAEWNTTNPGATAVTVTLAGVPPGVVTEAILNSSITFGTSTSKMLITSLASADTTPSASAFTFNVSGGSAGLARGGQVRVNTNTSQQIRYRLDASGAADVAIGLTYGW